MLRYTSLRRSPTTEHLVAALRVLGIHTSVASLSGSHSAASTTSPPITPALIRAKYLDLARRHHPDLSSGDDATMKVVNAAYELVQAHSHVLEAAQQPEAHTDDSPAGSPHSTAAADGRFVRKGGLRRRRLPDDFADGESWAMKSQLDWETLVGTVSEQELKNPANHPFSHSKFFSFEDDAALYRMIRSGATVPQVARSLGKPATFIERRLQNAQFKQRIQYVLRGEKRDKAKRQQQQQSPNHLGVRKSRTSAFGSIYNSESVVGAASVSEAVGSRDDMASYVRRMPWEATRPSPRPLWRDLTLEEKGRHSGVLPDAAGLGVGSSPLEHHSRQRTDGSHWHAGAVDSKVGKSYANYKRFSSRPSSS